MSSVDQHRDKTTSLNPESAVRRYPTLVHVAVLTSFIAPIAFVPYLLARRQVKRLRRDLDEISTAIRISQRESRFISHTVKGLTEKEGHLEAQVKEMARNLSQVAPTTEKRLKTLNSEIDRLKDENEETRVQTGEVNTRLGVALANIAGFMEQSQRTTGVEAKVEPIRMTALKLLKGQA